MKNFVFVINSGSSSLKYQLLEPKEGQSLASGLIERIGENDAHITHFYQRKYERNCAIPSHRMGLDLLFSLFSESGLEITSFPLIAIGHRVVHGGEKFSQPTLINSDVMQEISHLSSLAPLHNPANLLGIEIAQEFFPQVPHVAVFDTAFFHTLPQAATTYAIDAQLSHKYEIRRYGFHGTSHHYVSQQAATFLGKNSQELNQIVLHLGNGASASAVQAGLAVDTSMGLTPLEGLVMGTRPGDIDPGIIMHLKRNAGLNLDEIDVILNRRSGIKGLCGVNDFRELGRLMKEGNAQALLAYEVYIHRLRKYIGAYLIILQGADTIVFTGGVGENDAQVRVDALSGLEKFGIIMDPERNSDSCRQSRLISADSSRVKVLVIPTNEELAIARAAAELVT